MLPPLSRRTLLSAAGIGAAASVAPPAFNFPAHAAEITASVRGLTLTYRDGWMRASDADGVERVAIQGVYISESCSGIGGTVTSTTIDGRPALLQNYICNLSGYSCKGTFVLMPGRLRATFEVVAPDDIWADGMMIWRRLLPFQQVTESNVPLWKWTTDSRGGVPFTVPTGTSFRCAYPDGHTCFELATKANPSWVNPSAFHAPATRTALGTFRTSYDFVIDDVPLAAASCMLSGDTLTVSSTTPRKFHWFEGETSALDYTIETYNTAPTRPATLTWQLMDFHGRSVDRGKMTMTLPNGAWSTRRTTTPQPRGIYFLRTTLTSGQDSALSQINLVVLPDHTAQGTWRTSPFGVASMLKGAGTAYGITQDDWVQVLKRLGVRWLRSNFLPTETADAAGIAQNCHHSVSMNEWKTNGVVDTAARDEFFAKITAECTSSEAHYEEWCNEINSPHLTGETAATYVHDYLAPLKQHFTAHQVSTKLCAAGLGGPDHVWLKKFVDEGGWPLVDAISLHPGRGNFTPDWAPAPETWALGNTGSYWNFLGGLRKIRQDVDQYNAEFGTETPLFLTEAYCPTFPNSWWEDTYRTAAENVLLTTALAISEGVSQFDWYCLNDSVWFSVDTANAKDREWHFGMFMIDTSFKPSAIAYATAAEHLSDARFVRWLTFKDEHHKGLLFDTPRGPLMVLWSRKDGYVLNADHGSDAFYPSPDPWVDVWKTKTTLPMRAATANGTVTQIDCVGTQQRLKARDRKVDVVLDGAARFYYGLEVPHDGHRI